MQIVNALTVFVSLIFLLVAVVMDFRTDRIFNGWILCGLVAGIILRFAPASSLGVKEMVVGFIVPLLIGWVPFRMGALGAGDVKAFLVIGWINGGTCIFYCIFLSFLLAAGISLGRLLVLRQLGESLCLSFQYFHSVFKEKALTAYPGRMRKGHTIHFSAAILGGYVLWIGGTTCKEIMLYWAA